MRGNLAFYVSISFVKFDVNVFHVLFIVTSFDVP